MSLIPLSSRTQIPTKLRNPVAKNIRLIRVQRSSCSCRCSTAYASSSHLCLKAITGLVWLPIVNPINYFFPFLRCIGVWISICVCSIKPKCFCKKDNKNTNRTRFICLMVFFGFVLSIIVLGIVLLVYIKNAEFDFNGTICSLLMFQYQIINGQGILSKKPIYKPYWYGSNGIRDSVMRCPCA